MKKIRTTIDVNIDAEIKYHEDIKIYVAYTPIFGIFSQGDSTHNVKIALKDVVESFLKIAHEKNLLERCLKDIKSDPII